MASYQSPELNNNQPDVKIETSIKFEPAVINKNIVRFHLAYGGKSMIAEWYAYELQGIGVIVQEIKTPENEFARVEYDIYIPNNVRLETLKFAMDLAGYRRHVKVDEEQKMELDILTRSLLWSDLNSLYGTANAPPLEPLRVWPPLPTKEEKEREKQKNLLKIVSDTKFVRVNQAQQQRPSSLRPSLFSILSLCSIPLLLLVIYGTCVYFNNGNNHQHGSVGAYWYQMNMDEECGGSKQERRPYLSALYETLPEAEKWWMQTLRDIAKKVNQIQNAVSLGESKVRDLNDEFNKLLREKDHWERRIWQLGGPNYSMHRPPRMSDSKEGKEIPESSGSKCFGEDKDLAGVRELFEPEPELTIGSQRKTSGEHIRDVDADYNGYRDDDDDDGVLEPFEKIAETEAIAHLQQELSTKQEAKGKTLKLMTDVDEEEEEGESRLSQEQNVKNYFIQVPLQEEIERKRIIALKKKKTA